MRRLGALASSLAALGVMASASARAEPVTCFRSEQYFVAATANETNGSSLAVKALQDKAASPPCVYDAGRADYVLFDKGDDADEPKQLVGKDMILELGLSPDVELVVVDLSTRRKVIDVQANEYAVSSDSLVYWERVRRATAKDCPDFAKLRRNDLGEWISMKRAFSFATGKIARFPDKKCEATQGF